MGRLSQRLRRSASRTIGGLLTRAIVKVAPPDHRDLEASLLEELYGALLGESLWQRARHAPADLAARALCRRLARRLCQHHSPRFRRSHLRYAARRTGRQQSMYIAVGKWLGTFFAWVATALTITTSPGRTSR
jgi:hypothetical protein